MFKALQLPGNRAIIILDAEWEDVNKLNELRSLDHGDLLICQECRQPVRVRAGDERQWHFAHKQRQNCTYQTDTPSLLRARAVLYQRLVERFGRDHVELEKKIDGVPLPRPIDCYVRGEKGIIAFWILDSGITLHARTALQEQMQQLAPHVQWLFTTRMLREQEEPGRVTLTTTERALMFSSRYDAVYELHGNRGSTLHYLDGATRLSALL